MSERLSILIVGSGAREDALARLACLSPKVETVYVAPGNVGMSLRKKVMRLPELKDNNALARFAKEREVDLTIVGPEAFLATGIVDQFEALRLPIVGPTQEAAQIEGSKTWAKKLMKECEVPTADFWATRDPNSARMYAKANLPCVIKADGLAGGKGVDVCFSEAEADAAIGRIMVRRELGDAGSEVVIEEFLQGYEVSYMVLTDGSRVLPLVPAMDHKKAFDGDKGPNTGGMGAVAPIPTVTKEMETRILQEIAFPLLSRMQNIGATFKGCFYLGLMITKDGPKVLEVNCRFGDPELQAVAMLIKGDIIPTFQAIARGKFNGEKLDIFSGSAASVVMASGGYPDAYAKGKPITGLGRALKFPDSDISYGAVALKDGDLVTDGGRVLTVTKRAPSMTLAINGAYQLVSQISWDGEYHRHDIGDKVIANGIQLALSVS